MLTQILSFLGEEEGPTAVEYAVLLAMILMAVLGSVTVIGNLTLDSINYSASEIERTFPEM